MLTLSQLTNRTGLCPLGSCFHPFPWCASPGGPSLPAVRCTDTSAQGSGKEGRSFFRDLVVFLELAQLSLKLSDALLVGRERQTLPGPPVLRVLTTPSLKLGSKVLRLRLVGVSSKGDIIRLSGCLGGLDHYKLLDFG